MFATESLALVISLSPLGLASPVENGATKKKRDVRQCLVQLRSSNEISDLIARSKDPPAMLVAAGRAEEKLALPLLAALASKSALVGYTEEGLWVYRGPESMPKALIDSGLAANVALEVPRDFKRIEGLILLYDLPSKPTKSSLSEAKLVVIEDHTRKRWGYLTVRYLGTGHGIPPAVIEKVRSLEGITKADINLEATAD
jgi:hypothetical protein